MPQPSAFPQVEYLQGTEITRVKAISLTDPLWYLSQQRNPELLISLFMYSWGVSSGSILL